MWMVSLPQLDRGICSEHFDSLLQLAQRMTNPKPELRPVLSEVVRVIAANGASRAGGLALDGSQIGAVAGKVGARECACSKPRHPAITDVATTERTSVCCYQPNWRQLRRGSRHRGCRIATAILGSVESFYLRICPDLTGASWQRGPEAGQAGFADAWPRTFTHPFCAYCRFNKLSGFTGYPMSLLKPLLIAHHAQVLLTHALPHKHTESVRALAFGR